MIFINRTYSLVSFSNAHLRVATDVLFDGSRHKGLMWSRGAADPSKGPDSHHQGEILLCTCQEHDLG